MQIVTDAEDVSEGTKHLSAKEDYFGQYYEITGVSYDRQAAAVPEETAPDKKDVTIPVCAVIVIVTIILLGLLNLSHRRGV